MGDIDTFRLLQDHRGQSPLQTTQLCSWASPYGFCPLPALNMKNTFRSLTASCHQAPVPCMSLKTQSVKVPPVPVVLFSAWGSNTQSCMSWLYPSSPRKEDIQDETIPAEKQSRKLDTLKTMKQLAVCQSWWHLGIPHIQDSFVFFSSFPTVNSQASKS